MIADLKPYAEYKDSGLPWLGQVPRHWETERTKWRFRHRKELNADGDHTNVLSLTLRGVVNNDPDDPEGLVPKDYRTYQFFAKGDLVFKLIDLENLRTSRVGLVHEDGIMSSAYVRLVPTRPGNMRYFFHQFYDLYSRGIYNQLGAGVRSTLGPTDLLNVEIAIPPPADQATIVRFLDWANGRLERAIRTKRKVIALLGEQKQAIIHRAVTRGLDPSVPLKPSGIRWLGDIPQHWEVLRGKYLGRLCSTPSVLDNQLSEDSVGNPMYLKVSDLVGVDDSFRLTRSRLYLKGPSARRKTTKALLVFPKRGGAIYRNRVAIVDSPCFLDPNLMGWEINDGFDPHYIALLLKTRTLADLADVSSVPQINNHHIDPIPFPAPPASEQGAIVVGLKVQLIGVNTATSRLEREIELLRMYRTRLVADVVTGKLDVREAAARLPDEAPLDTIGDDSALGDETEAADEEAAV